MTNYDIIQEIKRLRQEAYSILGLSPGANMEAVNSAYNQLAFEYHPDRHPQDPYAFDRFKMICNAREIIAGGKPAFEKQAIQNLMSKEQGSYRPPPINPSSISAMTPSNPPPINPDYMPTREIATPSYNSPIQLDQWRQQKTTSYPQWRDNNQDYFEAKDSQSTSPEEQAAKMFMLLQALKFLFDMIMKGFELYLLAQANTVIINNGYQDPYTSRTNVIINF